MRLCVAVSLLGAACGSVKDDRPDAPGAADAPDHVVDAARGCYGVGIVSVCFASPPTGALSFMGDGAIDTDSSMCSPVMSGRGLEGNPCVVAASTISIAVKLVAHGSRPLILVADTTIDIAGTLDASTHPGGMGGIAAGSDPVTCAQPGPSSGASGGTGGSFGGVGGVGGAGGGGTGGTSTAGAMPTSLRGGCRGASGAGPAPGSGGPGGGAVYLLAGSAISISGTIDASGAGGDNGSMTGPSGGSGGGSGGMIGLDAPTVSITGSVFANGGGGAGGASSLQSGTNGADPTSALAPAAGGTGGGGHGGPGSAGTQLSGSAGLAGGSMGGMGTTSGGGGGGGAGVIKRYAQGGAVGTNVSPPPSS